MISEEIIREMVADHNRLVQKAIEMHHEREKIVSQHCVYSSAGWAIPKTVTQYTESFMESLAKVVAASASSV